MIKWASYRGPDGRAYTLHHLHPVVVTVALPPTTTRPARAVTIQTFYGLHCFTRGQKDGEPIDPAMIYHNNREGRLFCSTRWTHSLELPRIVTDIADRKCWETDRRNHVMFSAIETEQDPYALFFVLSRAGQDAAWDFNLNVISAHPRRAFRPPGKPNKFRDLLRAKL